MSFYIAYPQVFKLIYKMPVWNKGKFPGASYHLQLPHYSSSLSVLETMMHEKNLPFLACLGEEFPKSWSIRPISMHLFLLSPAVFLASLSTASPTYLTPSLASKMSLFHVNIFVNRKSQGLHWPWISGSLWVSIAPRKSPKFFTYHSRSFKGVFKWMPTSSCFLRSFHVKLPFHRHLYYAAYLITVFLLHGKQSLMSLRAQPSSSKKLLPGELFPSIHSTFYFIPH